METEFNPELDGAEPAPAEDLPVEDYQVTEDVVIANSTLPVQEEPKAPEVKAPPAPKPTAETQVAAVKNLQQPATLPETQEPVQASAPGGGAKAEAEGTSDAKVQLPENAEHFTTKGGYAIYASRQDNGNIVAYGESPAGDVHHLGEYKLQTGRGLNNNDVNYGAIGKHLAEAQAKDNAQVEAAKTAAPAAATTSGVTLKPHEVSSAERSFHINAVSQQKATLEEMKGELEEKCGTKGFVNCWEHMFNNKAFEERKSKLAEAEKAFNTYETALNTHLSTGKGDPKELMKAYRNSEFAITTAKMHETKSIVGGSEAGAATVVTLAAIGTGGAAGAVAGGAVVATGVTGAAATTGVTVLAGTATGTLLGTLNAGVSALTGKALGMSDGEVKDIAGQQVISGIQNGALGGAFKAVQLGTSALQATNTALRSSLDAAKPLENSVVEAVKNPTLRQKMMEKAGEVLAKGAEKSGLTRLAEKSGLTQAVKDVHNIVTTPARFADELLTRGKLGVEQMAHNPTVQAVRAAGGKPLQITIDKLGQVSKGLETIAQNVYKPGMAIGGGTIALNTGMTHQNLEQAKRDGKLQTTSFTVGDANLSPLQQKVLSYAGTLPVGTKVEAQAVPTSHLAGVIPVDNMQIITNTPMNFDAKKLGFGKGSEWKLEVSPTNIGFNNAVQAGKGGETRVMQVSGNTLINTKTRVGVESGGAVHNDATVNMQGVSNSHFLRAPSALYAAQYNIGNLQLGAGGTIYAAAPVKVGGGTSSSVVAGIDHNKRFNDAYLTVGMTNAASTPVSQQIMSDTVQLAKGAASEKLAMAKNAFTNTLTAMANVKDRVVTAMLPTSEQRASSFMAKAEKERTPIMMTSAHQNVVPAS
jgi:hypothetical protein